MVVLASGVGKVNAAACTEALISDFCPGFVVNAGVAGSIDPTVVPGSLVVPVKCFQHDLNLISLGYALGEAPGQDTFTRVSASVESVLVRAACQVYAGDCSRVHSGVLGTGDSFVASSVQQASLAATTQATLVDMEGAAVATVCSRRAKPFGIVKYISDCASDSAASDYVGEVPSGAEVLTSVLLETVRLADSIRHLL